MRTLPAGLQDHLDSGATTLCRCWRLETRGGEVMGFTDHDRDLVFDGLTYEAEAGFTASEMESTLGLAVDNLEAAGALSSERLSEERLSSGDFDDAGVDVYLVNWQDVAQRVLLRRGNLGEVTRGSQGFTAELRGLAHALNQPQGRIYQYGCDAMLGDARCGVDLDDPAFSVVATIVTAEEGRRLIVAGADGFEEGWFARGTAEMLDGANAGRIAEIKIHREAATGTFIEFWQPLPVPPLAGQQLRLRAGCDKQFRTCRTKFANTVNFRGFPHIPGDDVVLTYAAPGDAYTDGESRNTSD